MDVVEAIKELMGCDLVDGATHTHALLEEKDPTAKLKKLTLSDLNKGMLLLKVDEGRKVMKGKRKVLDCMSPLFRIDGMLGVTRQIRKERFIIFQTQTKSLNKSPTRRLPREANSAEMPDRQVVSDGDKISCRRIF